MLSGVPTGFGVSVRAAGVRQALALTADGAIVVWGDNTHGQISNAPTGSGFDAVASGHEHALALKDGSIVAWGRDDLGQVSDTPTDNDFVAIAAGNFHNVALKADGSIVSWGYDPDGEVSNTPAGDNFVAIDAGAWHSLALAVEKDNTPPVARAGGPYLVAIDESIMLDGSSSYDPDGDVLSYFWNQPEDLGDFDDDTLESPSFTGVTAGVTNLELWVSDGADEGLDSTMLVVYDPSGGFVTGGGWIDSPAGAYVPDPFLAGQANFGFVSKYKRGASTPTGNTTFVFEVAALEFHSSSYDWLVVNQGGTNAQFKGAGSINDDGDYRFMLWAGDGAKNESDTFRIKIWDEDEAGNESVIYDNGPDQPIGGGSIVVHKK